jgi:hypothetical protein
VAAPSRDTGVRIPELAKLRRDLKRVSPEVNKQLGRELKEAGKQVALEARRNAPKRTGAYARSIKPYAMKGGVSVGSRLPQAGVLHWGGTITPRGVPIKFERRPVVWDAADRQMDKLVERVGDAFDDAARKAGWK